MERLLVHHGSQKPHSLSAILRGLTSARDGQEVSRVWRGRVWCQVWCWAQATESFQSFEVEFGT